MQESIEFSGEVKPNIATAVPNTTSQLDTAEETATQEKEKGTQDKDMRVDIKTIIVKK